MFRTLDIKLSRDVVLPAVDLLRERADATNPASENGRELKTLLSLFSPAFAGTGVITIKEADTPAVLRACALLRIELRQKDLARIPDAALESGESLDPKLYTGEEHRAVMGYLLLATLQTVMLNPSPAAPAPFSSELDALKAVLIRIGNLFRPQRPVSAPAPQAVVAAPISAPANGWEVVVLNDPINLMDYVTTVFRIVLGLPLEVAQQRMREVHEKKSSVIWAGPREEAEAHVRALQSWHLHAVARPAPS